MPIHSSTYPDQYDLAFVGPNTNEALALKAVRDAPGSTPDDLVEAVPLDDDAISGALYRLRQKDLLVRSDDGTHDLSSYIVIRLADSLVPSDEA